MRNENPWHKLTTYIDVCFCLSEYHKWECNPTKRFIDHLQFFSPTKKNAVSSHSKHQANSVEAKWLQILISKMHTLGRYSISRISLSVNLFWLGGLFLMISSCSAYNVVKCNQKAYFRKSKRIKAHVLLYQTSSKQSKDLSD